MGLWCCFVCVKGQLWELLCFFWLVFIQCSIFLLNFGGVICFIWCIRLRMVCWVSVFFMCFCVVSIIVWIEQVLWVVQEGGLFLKIVQCLWILWYLKIDLLLLMVWIMLSMLILLVGCVRWKLLCMFLVVVIRLVLVRWVKILVSSFGGMFCNLVRVCMLDLWLLFFLLVRNNRQWMLYLMLVLQRVIINFDRNICNILCGFQVVYKDRLFVVFCFEVFYF